MTPNFYALTLLNSVKHIEEAIRDLSQIMGDNKSEYRTLVELRASMLKQIEPWIKPLGQVLARENGGVGTWVININDNRYYQFASTTSRGGGIVVNLVRHNGDFAVEVSSRDFDKNFRLADPDEVKQHEEFLMSKIGKTSLVPSLKQKITIPINKLDKLKTILDNPTIDPSKCEFYMVTCTGQNGSKVRHNSYELAEKEALRIANEKKHSAWVVGVVAKIEPEVKTTFNVKKSW